MSKLFCLIAICALCFSHSAHACITPLTKINMSKTSLEKNPIVVHGKNIYFDKGTKDEIIFEYDRDKKKWCVLTIDKPSTPDCTVQFPTFVINSKKETYANIEMKGNKLTVFPLDKKERKINAGKTYIEFVDDSNDIRESVDVISSYGSKISVSRHKAARSLEPDDSQVAVDLSKSFSGSIGCGAAGISGSGKSTGSK